MFNGSLTQVAVKALTGNSTARARQHQIPFVASGFGQYKHSLSEMYLQLYPFSRKNECTSNVGTIHCHSFVTNCNMVSRAWQNQ